MKRNVKLYCIISVFLLTALHTSSQKNNRHSLRSPNNQLIVDITNSDKRQFSLSDKKWLIISPSAIGMELSSGKQWGSGDKIKKIETKTIKEIIPSQFYKKKQIEAEYNQLRLFFDEYIVEFRAYNEGVAYRFESLRKKPFIISNEKVLINFPKDYNVLP